VYLDTASKSVTGRAVAIVARRCIRRRAAIGTVAKCDHPIDVQRGAKELLKPFTRSTNPIDVACNLEELGSASLIAGLGLEIRLGRARARLDAQLRELFSPEATRPRGIASRCLELGRAMSGSEGVAQVSWAGLVLILDAAGRSRLF
jgi:hypothetical protein